MAGKAAVVKSGKVLDRAFLIRATPARLETEPRYFVTWGGRTVELDGNLPRVVERAIPMGWGARPVADWTPFVRMAAGAGIL
jgi:hypothetical protein